MAKKKGKEEVAETDGRHKPRADSFDGARLKTIREEKGLTIVELSERTKISKAVLHALEAERYEDMPNARVYVRGFVRCLARELELDLDAVTKSYLPGWERWVVDHPDRY